MDEKETYGYAFQKLHDAEVVLFMEIAKALHLEDIVKWLIKFL